MKMVRRDGENRKQAAIKAIILEQAALMTLQRADPQRASECIVPMLEFIHGKAIVFPLMEKTLEELAKDHGLDPNELVKMILHTTKGIVFVHDNTAVRDITIFFVDAAAATRTAESERRASVFRTRVSGCHNR